MADTGGGLDRLFLDTVLRSQGVGALAGVLVPLGLVAATVLAGSAPWWGWTATGVAALALAAAAHRLVTRAAETDRDLAEVLNEP